MRQLVLVPLGALFLLFVAWVNLSILFDRGRDKELWTARVDRWFEQRGSANGSEAGTDTGQDEGRRDQED